MTSTASAVMSLTSTASAVMSLRRTYFVGSGNSAAAVNGQRATVTVGP
jgi:hypothetical protein